MKIKHIILLLVVGISIPLLSAAQTKTTKAPAPKAKPAAPSGPAVGALGDVYSGATATEFAGNVKIMQGVMKLGEKYDLITPENKKVECTIKEMQIASTYLKVKEAPKDNEIFITFVISEAGVECSNAALVFPGSVKTYEEFQKIQKEYKPAAPPAKPGDNSNVYILQNK